MNEENENKQPVEGATTENAPAPAAPTPTEEMQVNRWQDSEKKLESSERARAAMKKRWARYREAVKNGQVPAGTGNRFSYAMLEKKKQEKKGKQWTCSECGEEGFMSEKALTMHRVAKHGFRISESEKIEKQRIYHRRHREKMRALGVGRLRARPPELRAQYTRNQRLAHLRSKGVNIKDTLSCSECGEDGFTNQRSLGIHKSRMHGIMGARASYDASRQRRRVGRPSNAELAARDQGDRIGELTPTQVEVKSVEVREVGPNFCPHCGHNLNIHKSAMKMAEMLKAKQQQ